MSDYIKNLKELLMENVDLATPASGGDFILGKCKFCPDGKNIDSRHMYINVEDNGDLPWCYCHLCHNTARLTSDILSNYFGIYDINFLVENTKYFNSVYKSEKYKNKIRNMAFYQLKNNNIPNELSDKKITYINNRLGTNLTYEDMDKLKICLDLRDLIFENKIDKLTRDRRIVEELGNSFIGFISADNAFVNMRNLKRKGADIHSSLDKRYVNYSLFDKDDNTQRFYIIPVDIDPNSSERIKVHVSEGTFDILSVFLNVRKCYNHNIYASVNGSGFVAVIKHFINALKLIYIELHLYIDNDMKMYQLSQISSMLEPYNIPVYIHRNEYPGEKDFGVRVEKIQERIERLI